LSVKKYQILQRRIDELLVRIVRDSNYSDEDEREIMRRMQKTLGENVEVVIQYVNSIPKSSTSGKHRFIVSEIPLFEFS